MQSRLAVNLSRCRCVVLGETSWFMGTMTYLLSSAADGSSDRMPQPAKLYRRFQEDSLRSRLQNTLRNQLSQQASVQVSVPASFADTLNQLCAQGSLQHKHKTMFGVHLSGRDAWRWPTPASWIFTGLPFQVHTPNVLFRCTRQLLHRSTAMTCGGLSAGQDCRVSCPSSTSRCLWARRLIGREAGVQLACHVT